MVQVAAVHVFVPGLLINTLDAAAHPTKPIHVAAKGGGKDVNVEKIQPKWDSRNHSRCYQWRQIRKGDKQSTSTVLNGHSEATVRKVDMPTNTRC